MSQTCKNLVHTLTTGTASVAGGFVPRGRKGKVAGVAPPLVGGAWGEAYYMGLLPQVTYFFLVAQRHFLKAPSPPRYCLLLDI